MASPLPPAGWLLSFEAAARHGGFASAADELGLSPAAVSQQMRMLENWLGFKLFERLPRGVRLTEMGRAYLPAVRRAFDDLTLATAGLFGAPAGPQLTIRAPQSFAALCLVPALPAFRSAHPGVAIRLCSTVWGDALDEEHVDIDIRYGDGRWPAERVDRLTEPLSVPVCPPGLLLPEAPEAALRALGGCAIHITGCEPLWALLARAHGLPEGTIVAALSADSSLAALELVSAGLGAAMVAPDLAERHIAEGRVRPVPGLSLRHDQSHYVILPRGRAKPHALAQLFRDWLIEAMASG